jgi:putative addiction module CopG family antidote
VRGVSFYEQQVAPDVEAMIREFVSAGRYDDADQVLREALQALDERDQLRVLRAPLIRANEQIDRGEFVEWTPDFMDMLSREADEPIAREHRPKRDVCPSTADPLQRMPAG